MTATAAKRMVRAAGTKDLALPVLGSIVLQSFVSHLEKRRGYGEANK